MNFACVDVIPFMTMHVLYEILDVVFIRYVMILIIACKEWLY